MWRPDKRIVGYRIVKTTADPDEIVDEGKDARGAVVLFHSWDSAALAAAFANQIDKLEERIALLERASIRYKVA